LWLFCFVCFSWAFGAFSIITHIVPHTTDLGISDSTAAGILGIIGGAGFVGRIAIGTIGDRFGARQAYLFSLFLLTIAFVILFFTKEMWLFYLMGITLGLGFGGVCALYGSMVVDLFGLKSHGVILGIAVACDAFGGAVGSVTAGAIFDVTGSYFWHIWICLILVILGFILISILKLPHYSDG
jgi:OFA family oxalate/formate antiporter-like MFS transporter